MAAALSQPLDIRKECTHHISSRLPPLLSNGRQRGQGVQREPSRQPSTIVIAAKIPTRPVRVRVFVWGASVVGDLALLAVSLRAAVRVSHVGYATLACLCGRFFETTQRHTRVPFW